MNACKYVPEADRDYILGKYHKTDGSFDPFHRFIRNDGIFSEASGLSGEEITDRISRDDAQREHLSHPVRKALALRTVLDHTRIACDPRDRFPAINMIDRPLNKTVVSKWKSEVFQGLLPEINETRRRLEKNGSVTMWPDYDHSVPVWDRVIGLGFPGILREAEEARRKLASERELTADEKVFFDSIAITYGAVIDLCRRLADEARKNAAARMAAALRAAAEREPRTFYEGLIVSYLYFMISEHIEGIQVRSLSNFDRIFYPLYCADIEKGVREDELRTDLAYYLLQFTAIGNYWNQPVFLGGTKADGTSEINPLSYLFLEVYDEMGIYNPKIQIKIGENTPKDLVLRALDMIRRGHSSIVFVSDALIQKALIASGATPEEARLCNVKGCYEYSAQGSMTLGMNYFNLMKPLEYTLFEGRDALTGEKCADGVPTDFASFEELYDCYEKQIERLVEQTISTVNAYEDFLAQMNPQPLLSATYPTCLEKACDALCGGSVSNDSEISFGFLANAADSLANIKKYVFDRRELTLDELRGAILADFRGAEELRLLLMNDPDKYGNNRELPDSLAVRIARAACRVCVGKPNAPRRGGVWNCGFHVARMSYTQGKQTAASVDGRHAGEELSKNLSASMGRCRAGVTGAILSATKINAAEFTGDACVDAMILPSAVKGSDGLEAMYTLLMTFVRLGGHALQLNVTSAEVLRAARREPEKYADLQIRVAGWNVLFGNILPEEQETFIRQAEGLE